MARNEAMAMEVDGVMYLVCGWMARCGNPTLKALQHPILGPVPCCERCCRISDHALNEMIDCEVVVETETS